MLNVIQAMHMWRIAEQVDIRSCHIYYFKVTDHHAEHAVKHHVSTVIRELNAELTVTRGTVIA